jgi:hypothetical protein
MKFKKRKNKTQREPTVKLIIDYLVFFKNFNKVQFSIVSNKSQNV